MFVYLTGLFMVFFHRAQRDSRAEITNRQIWDSFTQFFHERLLKRKTRLEIDPRPAQILHLAGQHLPRLRRLAGRHEHGDPDIRSSHLLHQITHRRNRDNHGGHI